MNLIAQRSIGFEHGSKHRGFTRSGTTRDAGHRIRQARLDRLELLLGQVVGQLLNGLGERPDVIFNNNDQIELKNNADAFASAANYLNKIGWKKNQPCFFKIELKDDIPKKYLNSSARKIKNKKKFNFFKKYIKNYENLNIKDNPMVAIIIPDKDIIPGAETLSPAYIIFENYEKILNWNRSLRFALAVCTLKESFKNEI